MREDLITFQTANLACEKGFTINVVGSHVYNYYKEDGNTGCISSSHLYLDSPVEAPQSVLQKWLRETHNIIVDVVSYYDESDLPLTKINKAKPKGYFAWDYYDEDFSEEKAKKFETYEEALEWGLQNALQLI